MRIILMLATALTIGACADRTMRYERVIDPSGPEPRNRAVLVDVKTGLVLESPVPTDVGQPFVRTEPIVDTGAAGFDPARYAADLRDCQAFAGQVRDRTVESGLAGAAIGAGMGAAIGASMGYAGAGAATGAAAGGPTGLLAGSAATATGRDGVLVNCLAGRGHRVLGLR